jgi:predicted small secreted protein
MKLFIMICVMGLFSACSTVAGIGKDIQSTADWTKEKMVGK